MIAIYNRITECDDGKHRQREVDSIRGLTVHHFGVPGVHDAAGIARFYRANTAWTGGQMPYTFVIDQAGTVEQALPLREVGPHALRWSSPTLGIVALGTFSDHAPPVAQWHSTVLLVAELCLALGLDATGRLGDSEWVVAGHTERRGATRHADKDCPGDAWGMGSFRAAVGQMTRELAMQRLVAAGVV